MSAVSTEFLTKVRELLPGLLEDQDCKSGSLAVCTETINLYLLHGLEGIPRQVQKEFILSMLRLHPPLVRARLGADYCPDDFRREINALREEISRLNTCNQMRRLEGSHYAHLTM